jgi:hypothetical protein
MDLSIRDKIKMVQDKLVELRASGTTDSFDLELYFMNNMTEIYDLYPSLIKRLCREENQDNSFLFKMLDTLDQVKTGEKSMAVAEMSLGEELAEKYLYPIVSKEELAKAAKDKC